MITPSSPIEEILTDYLQKNLARQGQPYITETTSLFATQVLDSINLVELIVFIEQHFQIKVEPLDISHEHFDDVQKIAQFIQRKQCGKL